MIVLAIFCLLTAGILGGLYVGHALGYQEGLDDSAWCEHRPDSQLCPICGKTAHRGVCQ